MSEPLAAWRRAATISLVFCLLLSLGLAATAWRAAGDNPVKHPGLAALAQQLTTQPRDVALQQQIRALDVALRRDYFRDLALLQRGRWLLAVGLLVWLVCLDNARRLAREPHRPPAEPLPDAWLAAAPTRLGVGALGLLAVLLGLTGATAIQPGYVTQAQPPQPQARPVQAAGETAPAADRTPLWPQFRGPGGLGVAPLAAYPKEFDGAQGQGVVWKTPVPLPGKNSPIVVGGKVFVTGATAKQREVFAFDLATGKLAWRQAVASRVTGLEVMEDTGYAAPTMTTDGQRVFALFATGDLAAFDLSGQPLWTKALGKPDSMYGHASSPILAAGRVVVQFDQGPDAEAKKSMLVALDAASGAVVWKTTRPVPNSWSTPLLVPVGDRQEIICCGSPWVMGYDAASGQELWRAELLMGDIAPSPVLAGGYVLAVQQGSYLAAIRPGGKGNVTASHVVWKAEEGLPDIVSPVSGCDLVILSTSEGQLTCYDTKTGTKQWEQALEAQFHASPTLVGDEVQIIATDGVLHRFACTKTWQLLGTATVGEPVDASPAYLPDGRVIVRGAKQLYCFGGQP